MKQTEPYHPAAQQAAGIVISAAAGKAFAAIVRRQGDGVQQTVQAVFELSEGLEKIVQQVLTKAGGLPTPLVIGLDSAKIRYLDITLPPASAVQLPQLIRTQAEAQLPLEGSRMQIAWRLAPSAQGYACTVAAVRLDAMDTFLKQPHINGTLTAIVPDAAGMARLRDAFFAPTAEVCIVLRRRQNDILLMLMERSSLLRCAVVHADPSDIEQRPGLVMQDLLMGLETLEQTLGRKCPLYLWPDKDPLVSSMTQRLKETGWQIEDLKTNPTALRQAGLAEGPASQDAAWDAAGLAMLALEETAPAFDFLQTRRLAQPAKDAKQRRRHGLQSAAALAVLVVLALMVRYMTLSHQVRQLERALAVEVDNLNAEALLSRLNYQEATARARLDVIEMIQAIQDSRDGLLLDSLEFEQAKPVKLMASAGGYEQVYGFQKRLEDQNGVTGVRLLDPRLDEKTKQVRFTLQFHYKQFTK